MKIGILGAGVSGLSAGKLLYKDHEVEILEKSAIYGGIAKTKTVYHNGEKISYHMIGGHCFNSKFKDVMDFVFDKILPRNEWNSVTRNAVIRFKGNEISYPIEFAVKQIFAFDKKLAFGIVKDLLAAQDDGTYANLEDWFRKKFGDTLTDQYFIPYNRKIWNNEPSRMDPAWVEGKLPIPNKESFFNSLIDQAADKMPHAEFYYPKSNNQNTFIDALADGLDIQYNYEAKHIKFDDQNHKWKVNDKVYDVLISTIPLNILPGLIVDCPANVLEATALLKYNKVSNVLWETQPTDKTWTYIPDRDNMFHRYIHIGNFFSPKKNYTITEVVGEHTYEEMVTNGKNDPFLITPVDHNISDHAYVVFDENYDKATKKIFNYLHDIGLYTLGRFGEWQYYNMDVCIKSSIDLVKKINDHSNPDL